MQEQIAILARLAEADQESRQVRERCANIPQEIERHEAELIKLKRQVEDHEAKLEDCQRERRALERDSDQAKARRREVEVQQFRVKNTAEYQALNKEIEEMRRRSSDFEDQALEIISEEEAVEAELGRVREIVIQEEKRVAEVRSRLRAELESAMVQRDEADVRRKDLLEELEPRIRTKYERVLKSKGDSAVVQAHVGACGGCFYQLPPQQVVEVKKGERLVICEGCGRMVVKAPR